MMELESCPLFGPTFSQSFITLQDLKIISGTLSSILSKSFGPRGQTTLLVSDTGQLSMVKDGFETFSCLRLSHPVASCIQHAAKKLIAAYGDGCKTMVCYLDALFCTLEKEDMKHKSDSRLNSSSIKNQMAKALQVFLSRHLPSILSDVEKIINVKMQAALKERTVSWILFHVMSTFFNGCIPQQAIGRIANLVVQYLENGCVGFQDYEESVQWIPSCVFLIPNKLYSSSYVESGFFLQRPLLYSNNHISNVKLICMLCPFDGVSSSKDDICLIKAVEDIIQHRHIFAQQFVAMLHSKGVSFIICSSKVPSYALQLCQRFGIGIIDCVEESDIECICCITGKSPVVSHLEDITSSCVIRVSSCTQLIDGQFTWSKIIFDGELLWSPRSLFLCAPSEDLGKQLKRALKKCMIFASPLLKDIKDSKGSELLSSDSYINKDEHAFVNNLVCGGGYFEMVLCQSLSDYCNNGNVSSTSTQMWCCNVISEMLMTLPALFHKSLSPGCKQKEWLKTLSLMRDRVKHGSSLCGVNANCELCNPLDSGVIEVVSNKVAVLYSTISLAVQLLNLDAIIGVNKPVQTG